MNRILQIIQTDARHVFTNVISLVVCVGMIVVPSFYAWFNIAGSWDPYGNTHNIRVALVNDDAGYKSDLMPVEVNVGERITSQLRASKSIGYVVTDRDEAIDGVSSGEYYAAIVIPQSFSTDLLQGLTDNSVRPTVQYYDNQKRNAIAAIVTDKASSAASQSIDEEFVQAAVEVGAGTLDELGTYLDDDKLSGVTQGLDDALTRSSTQLRQTSDNLRGYGSLVSSARSLVDGSDSALDTSLTATDDASSALREGADGVRDVQGALDSATTSVSNTLTSGVTAMDGVDDAIDAAFDSADSQAGDARDALQQAKDAVDANHDALRKLADQLNETDSLARRLEVSLDAGSTEWSYAHSLRITIPGINARVQQALRDTQDLSDGLGKAISDIDSARGDGSVSRAELKRLAGRARSSLSDVSTDYSGGLRTKLGNMADGIDDAADAVDDIGTQLTDTATALRTTGQSADETLKNLEDALNTAADNMDSAAGELEDLEGRLSAALASGDLAQLRAILSADAESLASFIAAPVQLDRTAVFPVENNGSAMAPFYTTLSIWIGAVVLCALVKVAPSAAVMERVKAKPRHAYFGRITFFIVIGFLQTLLVLLGDLFFLGIQCVHPWLMALACFAASAVFVNIVFSLTASFGDVGKAIAVVLMVIQVAGSGGTFPKEMLPAAFQRVYPFLPFVHAENCMRAAIAGVYGNDFGISLCILLSFIVPSLVLGLLLRKPVIRLNHWMERQLESTKVM